MNDVIKLKGVFAGFTGIIAYLYSCINELIAVLVFFVLFDYITGIVLAAKEKKLDPMKGFWGAVKKAFYSVVVTMGFLLDFTIAYISPKLGIDINTGGLIGAATICYLIGNEGISTTRNLINLGMPMPKFFLSIFGYIKKESENKIKTTRKKVTK